MPLVIYGAPLPPGLEAPTRGELRICIEKIVLDDGTLNHSPRVRFHFPGQDAGGSPRHICSSPNRFSVPIDNCAVSPLFWGEAKPSAHCLPATPREPRGPATLVYPIKVHPEKFMEYVHNMSSSPHRGLQLEVYVPSSYSGRPPVSVGKSILALDDVEHGKPLHGWFSVAHQQYRDEDTAVSEDNEEGGSSEVPGFRFIPVGKLKLSIQISFFGGHSKSLPAAHAARLRLKEREPPASGSYRPTAQNGDTAGSPNTSAHDGCTIECSSVSHSNNQSIEVECFNVAAPDKSETTTSIGALSRVAAEATSTAVPPVMPSSSLSDIEKLIARGRQLRERMMQATREQPNLDLFAAATADTVGPVPLSAGLNNTPTQSRGIPAGGVEASPGGQEVVMSSTDTDESDTLYTSQDSDEERFTVQLQRDEERHRSRKENNWCALEHQQSGGGSQNGNTVDRAKIVPRVRGRDAAGAVGIVTQAALADANTTVQLRFTDISFATTPMTEDVTDMRINVRLSKDITTEDPSSGPFSSYVHQVPLSQHAICLNFPVRSYSEEVSRLVVEMIKVKSRRVPTLSAVELSTGGGSVTYEVISEELLGLSIVGLYKQSRELVLRDPVSNLNNGYCHFSLRLRRDGVNASTSSLGRSMPGSFTAPQTGVKHSRLPTEMTTSGETTPALEVTHDASRSSLKQAVATDQLGGRLAVAPSTRDTATEYTPPLSKSAEEATSVQLRVCITTATQLPTVMIFDTERGSGSAQTAPNAFILLDEIVDASGKVVENWQVVSFAHGCFDRTDVIASSHKPQFNYECILQLSSLSTSLGEIRLTLWHHVTPSVTPGESEVNFWAASAYLGICHVDLRPLKYLSKLDGFYRILAGEGGYPHEQHEAAMAMVTGSSSSVAASETIGHVHVGISVV